MFNNYFMNESNMSDRFGDIYPENAQELMEEYNSNLDGLLQGVSDELEAAECAQKAWEMICG